MTSARLLSELLALPPEERREVAQRLLDSLDDPPSPEIEEAQYQEVLRRVRDIDEGKVELIPSEVVEADLRALVAQPRFEDEWDAEIQRRSQAIDAGAAKLHTHDEAMEHIFGSRRKNAI